jgi:predicted transcriptional regulator
MKAIIEVAKRGSAIRAARQQVKDSETGKPLNFRLSFDSAKSLFSELTPARLDLLDTLSKTGSCSIYALAKTAERNYSNVHTDVIRLEELGLIERTTEDTIFVPFDAVEIFMPLAKAA